MTSLFVYIRALLVSEEHEWPGRSEWFDYRTHVFFLQLAA
jgi:hypothetical protein